MKIIKYSIILLVVISVAAFVGCKGKNLDEHGHAAETHTEGEAEVEVLPEDIVELRDDQIKLASVQLGKVEIR